MMRPKPSSKAGRPTTEDRLTPDEPEGLMTSEDLFGDIVDALPQSRDGLAPAAPPRSEPIRVRINEAQAAAAVIKAPAKELPVDVDALLARLEPGASSPAKPLAPAAEEFAAVDHDEDLPDDFAKSVASALSPGEEDLPTIAARTATKFQVAPPATGDAPADGAVDLAAVAAEAFTPPPGTERPRERGNWRDDVYGPYQLLDRIAVGGMAEVFKAKRSGVAGFEKIVAVKRILPHLSDNKEFVDMFVDEAKMVAGLTHPNVVQIFDLGKIDKSYYIAMEYIHGRDLRTILRRAKEKELRLPLDLSVRVAGMVCAALEFAHRKKDDRGRAMEIVHRDVSPQNILISFEGDVKLTDFGIAKAATKASSTDRGALRGKLLYMSPEQAWGKSIDRRSDLYSLGLVLYEMITESKPFVASSEMTILEMVRKAEIAAPRTLNPKVPENLDRVIMKALARQADERYQDAAEMGRALERVMRERPPPGASELKRFMELLFDRDEREEAIPDDLFPGSEPRAQRRAPGSLAGEVSGEPTPTPDPPELSVDALLKKFGIK
jgi:serine/threonine protein kinase